MPDDATILVLPGGGYRRHAPHEAEPIVAWLASLGRRARVVAYPVGERHPAPLEAVRREIERERAHGATTVGLIGFSAGGHLAGHAALAAGDPAQRPDFAILGYPVVSLVRRPHVASRAVLVGDDGDEDAATALSLERLVTPGAPPLFVWHTAEDPVVPVVHSYALGEALAEAGVPYELHVFPGDVHGVGLADGTPAGAWTSLAAAWLARL